MTGSEISAQKGFVFDSRIPRSDRAKMRRTIRASFTQEEERLVTGKNRLYITTGDVDPEHSGAYFRRSGRTPASVIIEDPSNSDTVVHEITHHMRMIDGTRKGMAAAKKKVPRGHRMYRDVNNVEEAATVAEAAARTSKPASSVSGYYDDVPDVISGTKSKTQAYKEDRITMTNGTSRAVVGKKAVRSVNENFLKTNISRKKLGTIQARNSARNIARYERRGGTNDRK